MKVANPQVQNHQDAAGSQVYRAESAYNFLQYLKWRSRTRAVAPEKTSSISPVSDCVDTAKKPYISSSTPTADECASAASENEACCSDIDEIHDCEKSGRFTAERIFPNGDFYSGSWQGNLPEGNGKYLWADGCMYEGDWGSGLKTGRGRISWPSGATYEGDLMHGYLHGIGTYTGVDNATYKGSWNMNSKHGHGEKHYANGDMYIGSWKDGVQHGDGRYLWATGNEYAGEWEKGMMNGRGELTWANGDKFDGSWVDGLEHGHGVYTWIDGSSYIGSWNYGLKDGKGVFYPSTASSSSNQLEGCDWDRSYSSDYDIVVTSSPVPEFAEGCRVSERRWSAEGASVEEMCLSEKRSMSLRGGRGGGGVGFEVVVVEREYVQGVLINENVKHGLHCSSLKSSRRRQRRRAGETVIKGHRSYDLMLNLQLGIRYSVGRMTSDPDYKISASDFGGRAGCVMKFPRLGSQLTPPHPSLDFKFRDYCPTVFRSLREMFKIDSADYMMSICGNDALRELCSPGKSGSLFYLSHDDRFMIKTMRKSEMKVLLEMIPSYYQHVQTYSNTLITKFFGLHQVEPYGGRKVRFVVMANMFCTDLAIHRRFDLKGSSQGRSTDKFEIDENTTLKDLDLNFVFRLETSWRQLLLNQIEKDCRFLESQKIMDYSLLLGLHFRAPQYPALFSPMQPSPPSLASTYTSSSSQSSSHHSSPIDNTIGHHVAENQVAEYGDDNAAVPRLHVELGVNMPARADWRGEEGKVYDVVLYLGIIDILQQYDITKRMEHAYKSLHFDSQSISAVEPKLYANRFQSLIRNIFPSY